MAAETVKNSSDIASIAAGSCAPDLTLVNTKGETVRLSSLWEHRPLIAVFLRHYGCSFCKEQVIELRKHYQALVDAGAEVVCVAMGPYKAGRAFQIVMELPFEILTTGESVEAFRAYGLGKASVAQLLNPIMWWRVLVNMTRGIFNNPLQAQGDLAQLSGTFMIGTDGRFFHVNPAKSAYQVVAVDELLRYIPAR